MRILKMMKMIKRKRASTNKKNANLESKEYKENKQNAKAITSSEKQNENNEDRRNQQMHLSIKRKDISGTNNVNEKKQSPGEEKNPNTKENIHSTDESKQKEVEIAKEKEQKESTKNNNNNLNFDVCQKNEGVEGDKKHTKNLKNPNFKKSLLDSFTSYTVSHIIIVHFL